MQSFLHTSVLGNPGWSSLIVAYLLLPILWLLILGVRPLWLLRISEFFRWNLKVKSLGIEFDFPLRHLLLVSLFHYRNRVLNAWVNGYLVQARENFSNKQTVKQRKVYIPTPVTIGDRICESLSATTFQSIFDKKKVTILIVGEGGVGKTSMACQMAIWAMANEPEQRLCKAHPMLPVMIEGNLESRIDGKDTLVEAVRGGLRELIGESEQIFDELFLHMLRKRRVLVIMDSLSELTEVTRKSVRPAQADFDIAALIVTSRMDEELGGALKTSISPLRLQSNRLSEFMDGYLKQLGKRGLFDDPEYFAACGRLSEMVGSREITVLLAKMYAEQMIAVKEAEPSNQMEARELPSNLPDLMLGYIRRLNDQIKADRQDIRKVINVAKFVAWACLKQTCQPTTGKRDDVLKAFDGLETEADDLLRYLEERLQIIQTSGVISELIRFSLDPLAEYLAALYLIERCSSNETLWREFFDRTKGQPGAPETIKEFLLALRECCVEKGNDYAVPNWIKDEIFKLAGLDPEFINAVRLKQRIDKWITNLKSVDTSDRITAANTLGSIGSKAGGATLALIAAINDRSEDVRWAAASALGKIGSAAVQALIIALNDQDADVRHYIAFALGKIGPEAKDAVPVLITAINDPESGVRASAAKALGKIGPEAKGALSTLIALLNDHEADVRTSAAEALCEIGLEAKDAELEEKGLSRLISALNDQDPNVRVAVASAIGAIDIMKAVPTLISALNDQDPNVRGAAASALGGIGLTSVDSVPTLVRALNDSIHFVRSYAAEALGRIGPDAKEAVPALIAAFNDRSDDVRGAAASALGKIGSAAVQALIIALNDDQKADVREHSAVALGWIGPVAKDAVPTLINAVKDPDEIVRACSAEALGKIGLEAKDAVPELISALNDSVEIVRACSAEALGMIGTSAKNAVPALIATLKDQDGDVRADAAIALGRIGQAAKDALPALIEALNDQYKLVRHSAAKAINEISPNEFNGVIGLDE